MPEQIWYDIQIPVTAASTNTVAVEYKGRTFRDEPPHSRLIQGCPLRTRWCCWPWKVVGELSIHKVRGLHIRALQCQIFSNKSEKRNNVWKEKKPVKPCKNSSNIGERKSDSLAFTFISRPLPNEKETYSGYFWKLKSSVFACSEHFTSYALLQS